MNGTGSLMTMITFLDERQDITDPDAAVLARRRMGGSETGGASWRRRHRLTDAALFSLAEPSKQGVMALSLPLGSVRGSRR